MSETIAEELTEDRLLQIVGGMDLEVLVGKDGMLGVHLGSHFFHLSSDETRPHVALCRLWRTFGIQHVNAIQDFIFSFNQRRYCPKLFTLTDDAGNIQVRASHVFAWTNRATDQQVRDELRTVFQSTIEAFAELNSAFPDQWA